MTQLHYITGIVLCAITAFAQIGTNSYTQTGTSIAPVDLGTILVEGTPISKYRAEQVSTATFTSVKPEELPQTVDVLTEDFIEEMNPTDLHDMLRYQPGIYTGGKTMLDRTSGQYTIRGMSGSEAMLDGTLGLAGSMGIFMDPTAFERIEIVKGPVGSTIGGVTSTLGPYGAGGSVNLVLKQPLPAQSFREASIRTTIGEDVQRYRIGFDINEPVVEDKLTLRLPGSFEYSKPYWMPDSYRWRESLFLAPALLWNVRDDLRIAFNLTFQYTDQPGYQGIPIYQGKPLAPYDWNSDIASSDMRDLYIGHTIQSYVEWDASKIWTLRTGFGLSQADVEFEHLGSSAFAKSDGSLYAPSYRKKPYDHSEGDMIYRRYNVYERATATYETGALEHETVLQGDYSQKNSQGRSYFESVTSPDAVHTWVKNNYNDSQVDRYGFLAQDYISWEKFRLLGGARLDEHESRLGNTGTSFSPRGGISFLSAEWLVIFGNLSQTKAPNFGYLQSPDTELTSSWEATQYESGFRISPFDTLWLTTSFYKIEQNNTPTLIPDSTYYETEGETESQGIELSLSGNIHDNWSIYTAYAYNEYEDKKASRKFDRYPPHSLTATTSYRITSGTLDNVVLGFGYRYRHKYFTTMRGSYISEDYYINDSHVFDCSADVPLSKFGGSRNVVLTLAVKNIFDETYIESNRHYYQCFPGDSRTFEIALKAKF